MCCCSERRKQGISCKEQCHGLRVFVLNFKGGVCLSMFQFIGKILTTGGGRCFPTACGQAFMPASSLMLGIHRKEYQLIKLNSFAWNQFISSKAAYILGLVTSLLSPLEQLVGIPVPHSAFSPSGTAFPAFHEKFCRAVGEEQLRTDRLLGKDIGC